jgi:hypothetical protein
MKKSLFCILKINEEKESDPELDPDPDPFVRGTDIGSGSAPICHRSPTPI